MRAAMLAEYECLSKRMQRVWIMAGNPLTPSCKLVESKSLTKGTAEGNCEIVLVKCRHINRINAWGTKIRYNDWKVLAFME